MDEIRLLRLISDGQVHEGKVLIVGHSITLVELTMIARNLQNKGWIDLRFNVADPLLRILPFGQEALAAHDAVKKSEIDRQA